jgi:hypothetical protein
MNKDQLNVPGLPMVVRRMKERAIVQRNFQAIDAYIEKADLSTLSPEMIMGIFRASGCAKDYLVNWESGVKKAVAELNGRGLPADEIMTGLV